MPCAHSGAGARAVTSKRTEQASKEARGNSTSAGRASRRLAQLRGQSLSRRRQEEPAEAPSAGRNLPCRCRKGTPRSSAPRSLRRHIYLPFDTSRSQKVH